MAGPMFWRKPRPIRLPPAGFTIKPAPTPAEQAHNMVVATPPDKMDFAQWEFILSNGSQEDQDLVWNAIKGKAVQMNGTVIKATATEFISPAARTTSTPRRPTSL